MSLPYNPRLKEHAKALRKAGNLSEVLVWNQLKKGQLFGLDFDRQKIIGNYIVDFYCAEKGIVLEIDGDSHDSKTAYDARRDDFLRSLGLRVIHVQDTDVKKHLAGVIQYLRAILDSPPVEGRQAEPDGVVSSGFSDHPAPAGHPSRGGESKDTERSPLQRRGITGCGEIPPPEEGNQRIRRDPPSRGGES